MDHKKNFELLKKLEAECWKDYTQRLMKRTADLLKFLDKCKNVLTKNKKLITAQVVEDAQKVAAHYHNESMVHKYAGIDDKLRSRYDYDSIEAFLMLRNMGAPHPDWKASYKIYRDYVGEKLRESFNKEERIVLYATLAMWDINYAPFLVSLGARGLGGYNFVVVIPGVSEESNRVLLTLATEIHEDRIRKHLAEKLEGKVPKPAGIIWRTKFWYKCHSIFNRTVVPLLIARAGKLAEATKPEADAFKVKINGRLVFEVESTPAGGPYIMLMHNEAYSEDQMLLSEFYKNLLEMPHSKRWQKWKKAMGI